MCPCGDATNGARSPGGPPARQGADRTRHVAGFAQAAIEQYALGPGDRVLQFASASFDASALELCCSLLSGATLVTGEEGPLVGERLAGVLAGTHQDMYVPEPADEICGVVGRALDDEEEEGGSVTKN